MQWGHEGFLDSRVLRRCSAPELAAPLCRGDEDGGGCCPICLGEPSRPRAPSCGHRFCSDCIVRWLASSVLCPVCKRDVSGPGGSELLDEVAEPPRGAVTARLFSVSSEERQLRALWHVAQMGLILARHGL